MAQMTEATIAKIVAENIAAYFAAQNANVSTTALVSAPSRATAPVRAEKTDDTLEIVGKLTYVSMQGNGAQIDGETVGEKDNDAEWFNAKKGKYPFAGVKLGSTLAVSYVVLTDDQGRSRNRVLAATLVKAASKNTVQPRASVATNGTANITGLAVRATTPTTRNPDGCPRCGGSKHGKNGQGTIIAECAQNQYVKDTGESFRPHKAASIAQYAAWLDAHQIVVAITYDGKTAAKIGGENELSAATHYVDSVATLHGAGKPKRGRPAGSKNRPPVATPTVESDDDDSQTVITGKLLKKNNAGTKIQIQPKGQKFQWILVGTTKIKDAWLGKTITVDVDSNDTITSASVIKASAPKA